MRRIRVYEFRTQGDADDWAALSPTTRVCGLSRTVSSGKATYPLGADCEDAAEFPVGTDANKRIGVYLQADYDETADLSDVIAGFKDPMLVYFYTAFQAL